MEPSINVFGIELEAYQTMFLLIASLFGLLGWLMVFLETYRHFPKMDSDERFRLSFTNATVMTGMVLVIVYIAFYYYFRF